MKTIEVSLKEMLIYVLRRWKVLVIFLLIVAAALVAYGVQKQNREHAAEPGVPEQSAEASEPSSFGSYTLSLNVQLTTFKGTSADSYHITLATNDLLAKITTRYMTAANSAQLTDLFKGLVPADISEEDLRGIISVAVPAAGAVEITVQDRIEGTDPADLANAMYEYLLTFSDAVTAVVTDHNLVKFTQIVRQAEAPKNALDEQLGQANGILTHIRNGIVGAIIGLVLGSLLLMFVYLLRPSIQTPEQIQKLTGIPYLGGLRARKRWTLVDKLAGRMRLVSGKEAPAILAANLRDVADKDAHLLLTGSVAEETVRAFAENIGQAPGGRELRLSGSGDLNDSLAALDLLHEADAVVLVERIDRSTVKQVAYEKDRVDMAGKKILGYFLI